MTPASSPNNNSREEHLVAWSGYWKKFLQALPILLLVSFVAAAIAYVIARSSAPTNEIHFSYLVSLSEREDAPSQFRFDGVYAIQATDLFAATLAKWITTPENIAAAYEQAGLGDVPDDLRVLRKQIVAEKTAPQLVEVTVRAEQQAEADRLARGLRSVMDQRVTQYHAQGVPAATFRVVPTEDWAGVSKMSVPIVAGATFFFTFFLAVNILFLVESFKHEPSAS